MQKGESLSKKEPACFRSIPNGGGLRLLEIPGANAAGAEFHGGYSRTVAITEQFNVVEWIISLF